MKLGEKIKKLRHLRGLTQKELAEIAGISELSIVLYEKGKRKPRVDVLSKIAKALDISLEYLLSEKEENIDKNSLKFVKRVPVIAKIPAGFPENIPADNIIEYVYLPDIPQESFICIVKGDSMSPTLKDGDYIIFIPTKAVYNGDIVIVTNEWGEIMVKRYREKNGEKFLVSDNPEYPTFKPNSEYKIIGKVIGAWRKIRI